MIGGGRPFLEHGLGAGATAPCGAVLALPPGKDDCFLPGRQLNGETGIRVEHERRTVEHELVLATDLIEIDERQPGFREPRDGYIHAQIRLWPVERRTVRRKQDLSPRLL